MFPDKIQPLPQRLHIPDQILADHPHHFPQRISPLQFLRQRKPPQQRHIDRRTQLVHRIPFHPHPFRRRHRPPAIEPFRRLQPIAKLQRVLVNPDVLQHQRKRTRRRMLPRKLMMIEIPPRRIVLVPNIHHRNRRIRQFLRVRLLPENRCRPHRQQNGTRQKFVLMRTARMRHDLFNRHKECYRPNRIPAQNPFQTITPQPLHPKIRSQKRLKLSRLLQP